MQTKDTHVLFVQTMMHMAADQHLVCTWIHLTCIFTHRSFLHMQAMLRVFSETCQVVYIFASLMCSQV